MRSDFGEKLRRRRKAKKLTMRGLYRLTGIHHIEIALWERGFGHKKITPFQAYNLSLALDWRLSDMIPALGIIPAPVNGHRARE